MDIIERDDVLSCELTQFVKRNITRNSRLLVHAYALSD